MHHVKEKEMSKLIALAKLKQSVWYDFIQRSLLTSGELKSLVDQGVRGVTSNPAIFAKAIAGSADYDDDLKELIRKHPDMPVNDLYENLAFTDIGLAADVLKPTYEETGFVDGCVSLEVDPTLANNTEKTVSEALRLYETVNRPNVMIKVPATPAGIPAITELIGAGVNVNVTLIFGLENYAQTANAYLAGLEKLVEAGPSAPGGRPVDLVASVASVFISRVDTAVDKELEALGNTTLQGKIAIAGARTIYAEFHKIFNQPRWDALAAKGARTQRVLWASTSSKNPAYPDTLYVDSLIGPDTVNTIPPATLDAFLDHGVAEDASLLDLDDATRQLKELEALGVDLNAVTRKLQDDGVVAFVKPFDELMANIAEKRDALIAS